jgi:hypothetical protein
MRLEFAVAELGYPNMLAWTKARSACLYPTMTAGEVGTYLAINLPDPSE